MKKLLTLLVCVGAALTLQAQEISMGGGGIENPKINADNSVTFTFNAPNVATIEIDGEFLPPREIRTQQGTRTTTRTPLAKSAEGVFTLTTPPLESVNWRDAEQL